MMWSERVNVVARITWRQCDVMEAVWCRGDSVMLWRQRDLAWSREEVDLTETAWCGELSRVNIRDVETVWCCEFSRDNTRDVETAWCGMVSVGTVGIYPRYLLFDLALLDVLGRAFVMLCGKCWVMISGLLELLSLSFCRNIHHPHSLSISG